MGRARGRAAGRPRVLQLAVAHAPRRPAARRSATSSCATRPVTGYLWNRAFDPALVAYSPAYENSLHHSPRFQDYVGALADRLVARYGLHGRQIVEIGPGEGNFLALLCERGHNWGLGYDAAYDPERFKVATSPRMRIVRDHYPFDRPVDGELVVCQHVLEHLAEPSALVEGVRRSIPDSGRTAVYFEVPDATYMVSELAVWDLIYEHVSYFSAPTLELLFRRAGFDVTEVDRAFGDQYLYLEAVPAAGGAGQAAARPPVDTVAVAKLTELVASFGEHLRQLVATWTARLGALVEAGPVAVWGAGSKGVSFLNLVGAGRDVSYVVDVNPNKTGLYIPGTGQIVVAPDELRGPRARHRGGHEPALRRGDPHHAGRPGPAARGGRGLGLSGRPPAAGPRRRSHRPSTARASSQAALSTSPSRRPVTRRCPRPGPQAAPTTSPAMRPTTTTAPPAPDTSSGGPPGSGSGRSSAARASGSSSVPQLNSMGRPPRPRVRTPPRSTSASGTQRRSPCPASPDLGEQRHPGQAGGDRHVGEGQASGTDAVQRCLLQQRHVGDEGVPSRALERPSAGGGLQALQLDEVVPVIPVIAAVPPSPSSPATAVGPRRGGRSADRAERCDRAQADRERAAGGGGGRAGRPALRGGPRRAGCTAGPASGAAGPAGGRRRRGRPAARRRHGPPAAVRATRPRRGGGARHDATGRLLRWAMTDGAARLGRRQRGADLPRPHRAAVGRQAPRPGRAAPRLALAPGERPDALDFGCGTGEALLAPARAEPEMVWLGVDVHRASLATAAVRVIGGGADTGPVGTDRSAPGRARGAPAGAEAAANVRLHLGDGVDVLSRRIDVESLQAVQILFPDPWPKAAHRARRLIQAPFVELLVSRLRPQGRLDARHRRRRLRRPDARRPGPLPTATRRTGHHPRRPRHVLRAPSPPRAARCCTSATSPTDLAI